MAEPGWHPDPYRRHELRWWDGTHWSEHVSDQGRTSVDPTEAPQAQEALQAQEVSWLPPTVQQPTAPTMSDPMSGPMSAPPSGPFPEPPVSAPTMSMPTMSMPTVQQPTLGPEPGTRRSRVGWIVGGVVVVALVAGGIGLFALRGGDDDGSSGPDGSAAPVSTTAAPATTAAPLTLPTAPPTTAGSTTEVPTTLPPVTITPAVAPTGDVLVGALPTAADLPADWEPDGFEPFVDFVGGTGVGQGLCGGDGESARGWAAGAVGNAFSDYYQPPSTAWVSYWLIGFPDEASASAYLSITRAQAKSCTEPIAYELAEGSEPDQYDGFADGFGDDAVWSFDQSADAEPATVDGADEALELVWVSNFSTTIDGTEYGGLQGALRLYERYGSVVLVGELYGEWSLVGYSDEVLPDYRPDGDDLVAIMDVARPTMLERLRAAGVIG